MPDLNDYLDPTQSGPPPVNADDLASILGYSPPADATPTPQPSPESAVNAPITSPEQNPGLSSYLGGPAPALQATTPSVIPGVTPGTSLKAGQGAGVSTSGYSPAANAAIQAGPHAALGQALTGTKNEAQAGFAPVQAEFKSAADEARRAQLAESQAESDKILATSTAKQQIAAANTDFLTREQGAVDQARAESQANMANYKAALADFSAAKVNGAQLWENAGAGGQFQMMAAAFAHDFLGVKGMQTSGLDTVRSAIKQNIDIQLQNIQHKREVASGFKEIWDMQRAQSASDAEARARMYGFHLEALKNQIDADMGKYDSKLALTKGASAIAKLDTEQAKNDFAVQQHIDTSSHMKAQERIDVYKADLAASTAKYTANAHIEAAKIAAAAKDKTNPLDGVIADRNGLVYRKFLPGVPPEKQYEVRVQTQKVGDTVKNIDRLIQLQDQISKTPPDIGVDAIKKMQSEAARTAELVRNTTKMGIIYDNSGKQINEQEVKLYNEIVGQKDWWLNGDNVRTLGMLANQTLEKNESTLNGVSYGLQPSDPAYNFSTKARPFDPAGSALNEIYSQPGGGKHEVGADEVDKALGEATAPKAASETVSQEKAPPHAGAAWSGFVYAQHPGSGPAGTADPNTPPASGDVANQAAQAQIQEVPKQFVAVDKLAQLVLQGDEKASKQLDSLAQGNDTLALYAQYEKSLLNAR